MLERVPSWPALLNRSDTAKDAEILTLRDEIASGRRARRRWARGPQCRSTRRRGNGTRPPTLHRDDVTGPQPRASTRLHPAVDLHVARLQQLLGMRAVLGEASELEELADPDRVPGERDVEDWGAGHLAILPGPSQDASTRSSCENVLCPGRRCSWTQLRRPASIRYVSHACATVGWGCDDQRAIRSDDEARTSWRCNSSRASR
jgi:hypothetical protein